MATVVLPPVPDFVGDVWKGEWYPAHCFKIPAMAALNNVLDRLPSAPTSTAIMEPSTSLATLKLFHDQLADLIVATETSQKQMEFFLKTIVSTASSLQKQTSKRLATADKAATKFKWFPKRVGVVDFAEDTRAEEGSARKPPLPFSVGRSKSMNFARGAALGVSLGSESGGQEQSARLTPVEGPQLTKAKSMRDKLSSLTKDMDAKVGGCFQFDQKNGAEEVQGKPPQLAEVSEEGAAAAAGDGLQERVGSKAAEPAARVEEQGEEGPSLRKSASGRREGFFSRARSFRQRSFASSSAGGWAGAAGEGSPARARPKGPSLQKSRSAVQRGEWKSDHERLQEIISSVSVSWVPASPSTSRATLPESTGSTVPRSNGSTGSSGVTVVSGSNRLMETYPRSHTEFSFSTVSQEANGSAGASVTRTDSVPGTSMAGIRPMGAQAGTRLPLSPAKMAQEDMLLNLLRSTPPSRWSNSTRGK